MAYGRKNSRSNAGRGRRSGGYSRGSRRTQSSRRGSRSYGRSNRDVRLVIQQVAPQPAVMASDLGSLRMASVSNKARF